MPSRPPETIAQVKKGFKNVFQRRGRREGEGPPGAPIAVLSDPASSVVPVEAPSGGMVSSHTPRLTTNIPGSSLGAAAPDTPEEAKVRIPQYETQAPVAAPRASYAEGMSATSGPLGSSLEEVEEFERMVERRSSAAATEDVAAATSASQKVAEEDAADEARKSAEIANLPQEHHSTAKETETVAKAKVKDAESTEGGAKKPSEPEPEQASEGEPQTTVSVESRAPSETQEAHENAPGKGEEVEEPSKTE